MHCEIRETQLPEQTRDTICINFAGKVVRLEAHRKQRVTFQVFTLLGPTRILSIRQNSRTSREHRQDIPRGFAGHPFDCRLLDSAFKLIKVRMKGSFPRVYTPYRYYAFSTILEFYCEIFCRSIWNAAKDSRLESFYNISGA